MDLRRILIAALILVSQPVFSSLPAPDLSVLLPSANIETAYVNGIKDELLGLRTGALGYSTVDVRLRGLGPDITIRRTLSKTSSGPVEFGSWVLDVPRVVLTTNPNGWPAGGAEGVNSQAGICNDYSNPKYNILGGGSQSANWHTEAPELFLGNGQSEKLITLDSSLRGTVFPAGTKYITTSNTIVSCMEVAGRLDGYRVQTPDGLTYELTKLSRIPGDFYGGKAGKNIISVSRISDQLGNEVVFNYQEVRKPNAHSYTQYATPNRFYVDSISASDGRRVLINYETGALEGEYPLISSIEVEDSGDVFGSTVWRYVYTGLTTEMRSDYCHFLAASSSEKDRCNAVSRRWYQGTYLERVVLPDDSTWEFDYRGPIVGSVLDCCTVGGAINNLTRVKLPSGGVARYEYGQLGYQFFDDSSLVYETPVVTKRTLHDPITNQTNAWLYNYSKNESANYTRTEVIRPDGSERSLWFHRSGTYRALNYREEVNQAGSRKRLVSKEFDAGANLGSYIGHSKFSTRYVALKRSDVDGLYTSEVLSRDALFRETMVKEEGNATRVVETFYLPVADLSANTWMLNRIERVVLSGGGDDEAATIKRTYTSEGLLKSEEQFGVANGDFEYTAKGELSSASSVASQSITKNYSDFVRGRPGSVEFGDGGRKSFVYDTFGNVITETDERGNQTISKYDALGRLRSLERPSLAELTVQFDPSSAGSSSKKIIKSGTETLSTYYYDGFGRRIASVANVDSLSSTSLNDNLVEQWRYDFDGNLVFSSHITGGTVSEADFSQPVASSGFRYSYDALSRLKETVDTSTGGSIEYCYDQTCYYGSETYSIGFGRLVVDERGYKMINRYDCYGSPADCVVSQIDRKVNNPSKIDYVVEAQSNSQLPDEWVTINIDRNILGNPTRVENAGVIRSFDYHPGSSLVRTQTQPESAPIAYTYHPNGSIRSAQQGDRQRFYAYNKRGLLAAVNTSVGPLLEADYYLTGKIKDAWSYDGENPVRTHFEYTGFGSVASHQNFPSTASGATRYIYNSIGHVEQMIYPHGDVVAYSPDLLGRATKLNVNGEELAQITRNTTRHVLSLSNGVVVEKGINQRGLSTDLLVKPLRVEVGLPGYPDGEVFLSHAYRYDRSNNLLEVQDQRTASLSKNFAYDGLSRLIWDGDEYQYDANSNIKFKDGAVFEYESNRLKHVGGAAGKIFEHDDFGRLTSSYSGDELTRRIEYNATDRVESITSGGATSLFAYDAFGKLIKSSSLETNSDLVRISHLHTDLFGRVLEKATGQDPLNPDRLVRYFYIEDNLVAEKELVENSPPVVTLDSVSTVDSESQQALLVAHATDLEDSDSEISDSILWFSDRDGNIGVGSEVNTSLSVGVHEIYATIVDSGGLEGRSSSVSLSIAPQLTIDGAVREVLVSNPDSYEFSLSIEPAINGDFDFYFNGEKSVETSMNVVVSGVDFAANNTIYLCRQNSVICSNTTSVNDLGRLNDRPSISQIASSGNANAGEFVTMRATAMDREQGNMTGAIRWFSAQVGAPSKTSTPLKQLPPGFFGDAEIVQTTGGTYSTVYNSVGTFRVEARVMDNQGLSQSSTLQITRNLSARQISMGYIPDWQSPWRVPSFIIGVEVTTPGVSSEYLQFYLQNSDSSWRAVSHSQGASASSYQIGPFPATHGYGLKVCDKSGSYCSASITN